MNTLDRLDCTELELFKYKGIIYKLAIIDITGLFPERKYAYVSEDSNNYIDNFYSGGSTGVGVGISQIKPLNKEYYGEITKLVRFI